MEDWLMKCRFVWTLLVPSLAFATNITVSFSGVTTNSLPGIAVGTQFTGSVTYTTTGVQVGAGVTSANYDLTDPANYLVLNIGSYVSRLKPETHKA
jgi:hypothetical protein